MSNMKKWNYIIAFISIILGTFVVIVNSELEFEFGAGDPGAGFWPTMLGGLLILMGILLMITNVKNSKAESNKTFSLMLPQNKIVYWFMLLTVAFCIALYLLGLLTAVFIFLPIAMYMLGARGKMIFIVDIIFVLFLYIVFIQLLHTPFPLPIWLR